MKSSSPSRPMAGQLTQNFSCPVGGLRAPRIGYWPQRPRSARTVGEITCGVIQEQFPELAAELDQSKTRTPAELVRKTFPSFPLTLRDSLDATLPLKLLTPSPQTCRGSSEVPADLTPSTKTRMTFAAAGDFQSSTPSGRNLHFFGIREHSMGAILNDASALSKLRPFGSGFLIFSDYGRGRHSPQCSLMEIPVIHIFTHDFDRRWRRRPDTSAHRASDFTSRAIPNLVVMRPCDANEVAEAWRVILSMPRQPVALILTRQALPTFDRKRFAPANGLAHGAYVLADAEGGKPDVLLMATGSEVSLCVEAYEELTRQARIRARVVSMLFLGSFLKDRLKTTGNPCCIRPAIKARVAVEQASTFGWARYTGLDGAILGMKTFGASAPLKVLQEEFGFTTSHVVEAAKAQVAQVK